MNVLHINCIAKLRQRTDTTSAGRDSSGSRGTQFGWCRVTKTSTAVASRTRETALIFGAMVRADTPGRDRQRSGKKLEGIDPFAKYTRD